MPYCPRCGKETQADAAFCTGCGAPTAPPQAAGPPTVPVGGHPPQGMSPVQPGPWPPYGPGYPPGYAPPQPSGGGANIVFVVIACLFGGIALIGILAAILVPNFIRARSQGQLTACKSNLKNIGTGLEMYSSDNQGRFPTTLDKLSPNYLKRMPTCPSVERDTYSSGYGQYHRSPRPRTLDPEERSVDTYTVVCTGANHGGVNQGYNYPQYTSNQGLISQ